MLLIALYVFDGSRTLNETNGAGSSVTVLKEETSMPAGPDAASQLTRNSGCGTERMARRTGLERGECGESGGGGTLGVEW